MDMSGPSIEQLRLFALVADCGSFSAAARRSGRAQSAVTYAIQALEAEAGVPLFDRSGYRPRLTDGGIALLPRARAIVESLGDWSHHAAAVRNGVEARLNLIQDVATPPDALIATLKDFDRAFPTVEIAFSTHTPQTASRALRDGEADIGLIVETPNAEWLEGIDRVPCGRLVFVPVAAPGHPLGSISGPIPRSELQRHMQILIASRQDRQPLRTSLTHGLHRWRVEDLQMRYRLLLNGVGWGHMPQHMVADDLAAGRLTALTFEGGIGPPPAAVISVAYPSARPPGPAGRWLVDRLVELSSAGDAVAG